MKYKFKSIKTFDEVLYNSQHDWEQFQIDEDLFETEQEELENMLANGASMKELGVRRCDNCESIAPDDTDTCPYCDQ